MLWPPNVKSWLIGKEPDAGKDWGQEEKQGTEDKRVGWHHWLNVHEFDQTLGDSGQRSLVYYSPWGSQRVGHALATEQWATGETGQNIQYFHFHCHRERSRCHRLSNVIKSEHDIWNIRFKEIIHSMYQILYSLIAKILNYFK